MSGIIGTDFLAQVGFIVEDVEKSKRKFAEFFGVEVPPNVYSDPYEISRAEYYGEPMKEASCIMAFFTVGEGIKIELIQPNSSPSTWREFLDKHGEGVHHLAFRVKGMQDAILSCENFGMALTQKGENATGRYAYLDATKDLKVFLELLENDPK